MSSQENSLSSTLEKIGRYEILSELGRGMMGRVFLARDPNIGRQVALKVLSPTVAVEPEVQKDLERRFIVEAMAAGRLNHSGIVMIFDAAVDEESGLSYIAMEWVDGQPLDSLVREKKRIPAATSAAFVAQVALALDYAHEQEVVHRDVKPANILVGQDGKLQVLDFGIAKLSAETATMAGQVLGTPAFMSPEQIRSEPLDGRSDLFSLGCVLYYCLTGRAPFTGDSIAAITHRILNAEPDPLGEVEQELPASFLAILEHSMGKDVEQRFQTGCEFAEALEPFARMSPSAPRSRSSSRLGELTGYRSQAAAPADATVVADGTVVAGPPDGRSSGIHPLAKWAAPALLLAAFLAVWLTMRPPTLGDVAEPGGHAAAVDLPSAETSTSVPVLPIAEESEPRGDLPAMASSVGDESDPPADLLVAPSVTDLPVTPSVGEESDPAADLAAAEDSDPRPPDPPPAETGPVHVAREPPSPRSRATSTLELMHRNRLGAGSIDIRVDGKTVWSREMRIKNPVRRLKGKELEASLQVPAGKHRIEVRITSSDKDVDSRGSIEAVLVAGKARRLRISLDRSRKIDFAWEE